ncbi:MAG: lipolytic protein family [Planctomycetaceae bacterium]|nr:lipolytic protein family [Planctomycetaceae bacterium]
MSGRNSESRRRRLLQRGLMGETPQYDAAPLADPDPGAEFENEISESPAPAEVAARSFLGTSSKDLSRSNGKLPSASNPRPRVPCGAGLATIKSLLAGTQPLTWVFTGDNTVQGAFYTHGQRSCVEIFSERLRAELRRSMDVVINTGISGDTVAYALSTLRWRVLRFKPDVVVVGLGLNDAKAGPEGLPEFEIQTQELLDEIRTQGAIPLVILPHPICEAAISNRETLPDYVEALRNVAARDEVPCVDHWNYWQKHWPSQAATRKRLHEGRMHLNAEAHAQLAALMFETLGIFDSQSACCKSARLP